MSRAGRITLLTTMALWVGGVEMRAFALEPSEILVIYNAAGSEGLQIASYYQQIHPGVQTLGLPNIPGSEEISAGDYLAKIRTPVLGALTGSTKCIVTTKGLPLRINNPKPPGWVGPWHEYSSLESELTKLGTIGSTFEMGMPWQPNAYYGKKEPFDPAQHGMRLTARLDGFSVDDVKGAIDQAQRAWYGWPGYYVHIDDDPNAPASTADQMEELVNDVLVPRGLKYTCDCTDAFINDSPGQGVLGYVSHGVYGGAPEGYLLDQVNGLRFSLADGAVMHTWESYNAYSFAQGGNRCGQGLAAEWIARGGTAATGNVEEPGANALSVTNEDLLFEMLLDGYSWGEAAWSATAQVSYVNTVIGDPLMVFRPWTMADATGDGAVNTADLAVLGANYGMQGGATMWQGDFNGDGAVNVADLAILGANYGANSGGGAGLPEPCTVALLSLGGIVVLTIKRKRS